MINNKVIRRNRKSSWNKGIKHSEETKEKMRKNHRSKKGYPIWNKGKKWSEETKKKISQSNKGKHNFWTGKKMSEEHRKRQSEGIKNHLPSTSFKKGQTSWNKGLTKKGDIRIEQQSKKESETKKRLFREGKLKSCSYWKGKHFSKEHIKKFLRRRDKSSLELKFEQIINKFNLPYKFVGNGDFFIERKCPDFINTNGEKIAIEVFCRKHKEMFRNGLERWKNERIKIFEKYGWKLLFFNEVEINEINIIARLM